jgi:CubicO group peptidase (beta-lactamase class C family)
MQCVERDLINLDDDITAVLPEWKDAVILTGLDEKNDSKPILAKAKNAITLR